MNSNGPCKSGFFLVSKGVLYKTKEAMSCSRDLDVRGLIVTADPSRIMMMITMIMIMMLMVVMVLFCSDSSNPPGHNDERDDGGDDYDDGDYDYDDGDDDAHLLCLLNPTRPLGVVEVCQPHLLPSLQQLSFANKFTFHIGHFRYKTEPFFLFNVFVFGPTFVLHTVNSRLT